MAQAVLADLGFCEWASRRQVQKWGPSGRSSMLEGRERGAWVPGWGSWRGQRASPHQLRGLKELGCVAASGLRAEPQPILEVFLHFGSA